MPYQLTLPKTIDICGRKFKIIRNRGTSGASFHVQERWIRISEGRTKEEEIEWLIHEIVEILLCIHDCRYQSEYADNNPLFVFTHQQFEHIFTDLVPILGNLKKYL